MPASTLVLGLDELLAKISTLAQMQMIAGGLLAAGAHLKTAMQVYPEANRLTRESVYGKTFKTPKQQRYFFWALAKGLIEVPYRRGSSPGSQNLKQAWTVVASNAGLTVEIGNAVPYGPLVQGPGSQSLYAKAVGWRDTDTVLDREAPAVVQYVKTAIENELNT